MGICEDRITEDSTELEKEFLKIYDGNLWTALEKIKDWQPPKPIVKIPQFLADWFEYQLKNNNDLDKFDGNTIFRIIQDVIKVSNDESTWGDYGITDEIVKFAEDNEELFLNLIVNCSLGYGYTVEKEKKYYLCEKNTGYYLKKKGDSLKLVVNPYFDDDNEFTQSEIDKLNVGSYEQIEVKFEEVEP